jgi:hypothetical protein
VVTFATKDVVISCELLMKGWVSAASVHYDFWFSFIYRFLKNRGGLMKSSDQARMIYEFCVIAARNKRILYYRDVIEHLGYASGVQGHAIRYGLELVWIACAHHHLPILTSIIVTQSTGAPNAQGFFVEDWEKESESVFNHPAWPDVSEIDWNEVWKNRIELSNRYGTRGYWGNTK